jgi:hypothetical protein
MHFHLQEGSPPSGSEPFLDCDRTVRTGCSRVDSRPGVRFSAVPFCPLPPQRFPVSRLHAEFHWPMPLRCRVVARKCPFLPFLAPSIKQLQGPEEHLFLFPAHLRARRSPSHTTLDSPKPAQMHFHLQEGSPPSGSEPFLETWTVSTGSETLE